MPPLKTEKKGQNMSTTHHYHKPIEQRIQSAAYIMLLWMILLAFALGLGGCATPAAEQAVVPPVPSAHVLCDTGSRRLLVSARDDAETLTIVAVDRSSTLSYWDAISQFEPYPSTVALTPGQHTLRVRYSDAIFYGEAELELAAEAGATYRLQRQVVGLSVRFWLVDAEGQQVGTVVSNTLRNGNNNG